MAAMPRKIIAEPTDNKGRRYSLIDVAGDGHGPNLRLYPNGIGRMVGHAWTTLSPEGILEIGDIEVSADAPVEPRGLRRIAVQWGLSGFPRENLRGHGLGTIMLRYVIHRARQLHATKVTGNVFADARAAQPHLLPWYRKHGFSHGPEEPGRITIVSLDLTRDH
jgi:GNAT superfamily N-acetyltransferase